MTCKLNFVFKPGDLGAEVLGFKVLFLPKRDSFSWKQYQLHCCNNQGWPRWRSHLLAYVSQCLEVWRGPGPDNFRVSCEEPWGVAVCCVGRLQTIELVESCYGYFRNEIIFFNCKQPMTSRDNLCATVSMFTTNSHVFVHILCQEMGRVGKLSRWDDPKWSTYRWYHHHSARTELLVTWQEKCMVSWKKDCAMWLYGVNMNIAANVWWYMIYTESGWHWNIVKLKILSSLTDSDTTVCQ